MGLNRITAGISKRFFFGMDDRESIGSPLYGHQKAVRQPVAGRLIGGRGHCHVASTTGEGAGDYGMH